MQFSQLEGKRVKGWEEWRRKVIQGPGSPRRGRGEHGGLFRGRRGSTFVEVGDRKQKTEAAAAGTFAVIFPFNQVSGIAGLEYSVHVLLTL